MREYFKITNECNIELMKRYPDNYFDLAVVDPPYGIGFEEGGQYFKKKNKSKGKKWDAEIPDDNYFIELFRVSKNQIIWGGNYFDLPPTRCVLAWTKTIEVQNRTFSEWEMAWTSFDSVAKYYDLKPFLRNGERIHPTQKPEGLYQWIFKNYAEKGFKILDTHLGSGSIAVALDSVNKIEKMELELVACELDKEYFDNAISRIKEKTNWNSLF